MLLDESAPVDPTWHIGRARAATRLGYWGFVYSELEASGSIPPDLRAAWIRAAMLMCRSPEAQQAARDWQASANEDLELRLWIDVALGTADEARTAWHAFRGQPLRELIAPLPPERDTLRGHLLIRIEQQGDWVWESVAVLLESAFRKVRQNALGTYGRLCSKESSDGRAGPLRVPCSLRRRIAATLARVADKHGIYVNLEAKWRIYRTLLERFADRGSYCKLFEDRPSEAPLEALRAALSSDLRALPRFRAALTLWRAGDESGLPILEEYLRPSQRGGTTFTGEHQDDLIDHVELLGALGELVEKKGPEARELVTELVLDFPYDQVRAQAVPLMAEVYDSPPRELLEQLLNEEDDRYSCDLIRQSAKELLKDAGWE